MHITRFIFSKLFIAVLCTCCYLPVSANHVNQNKHANHALIIEPVPPQKIIVQFLKWYKVNLTRANSFRILITDSAGNYTFSKTASNNYLLFLKSSKCVSPGYIEYWRAYFNDKAVELRNHPTQTDIPEGFDFDFVLVTQEPDILLNGLNRIQFKTVSISSTSAVIKLIWPYRDSMEYVFEMHKSKNGWQIGYISTPNFD